VSAIGPRRVLALGALLTVVGLALAATTQGVGASSDGPRAQQLGGGVIVLIGWAVLGWGVHRVGRSSRG
jgi:hypothetical protein